MPCHCYCYCHCHCTATASYSFRPGPGLGHDWSAKLLTPPLPPPWALSPFPFPFPLKCLLCVRTLFLPCWLSRCTVFGTMCGACPNYHLIACRDGGARTCERDAWCTEHGAQSKCTVHQRPALEYQSAGLYTAPASRRIVSDLVWRVAGALRNEGGVMRRPVSASRLG